jgi:ABC-type multidrug transport system fused ATPase/permease subunit
MIHACIREEFGGALVILDFKSIDRMLTRAFFCRFLVAHRLKTVIIDYDKLIVLDKSFIADLISHGT